MKKLILCIIIITGMFSCKESTEYLKITNDPALYSKTVKKLNDIVLENNFPPMIASRNYAYANIAAYEVIASGSPAKFKSLTTQVHDFKAVPPAVAGKRVDYPLAALLAFCKVGNAVTFPEGSMDIYVTELEKKLKDADIPSVVLKDSKAYADVVADAVLAWSKDDHYAKIRSASKFSVTDEEGRWVPTPPMYAQALEPHWMEMRTLVMDSCSQFKPVRPPKYEPNNKQSWFYKELIAVKNGVDSLTDEQKHMADFWDDNSFKLNVVGHVMYATKKFSPAGHWMNIVGIIAKNEKADFSTTVAVYAHTSIALFEAFISSWDEKYRSNYVRPESVINKYIDPDWKPYLQTPPFPEYTSGHAVISAAAAEVMSHYFGDNIQYTDSSELEFGIPNRSFTSVREAAKEAAISRVYGGIHFKNSCDVGNDEGIKIGQFVLRKVKLMPSMETNLQKLSKN